MKKKKNTFFEKTMTCLLILGVATASLEVYFRSRGTSIKQQWEGANVKPLITK
jgi:hypothetical protein